jgi:hypothetical protein
LEEWKVSIYWHKYRALLSHFTCIGEKLNQRNQVL